MKTKLLVLSLALIASNSHSMCYLEEEDLGPVSEEVAQAWQECCNDESKQQLAQCKKPRQQNPNPIQEEMRQEDDSNSEVIL